MTDDAKKRVDLPQWRKDFPIRWDDDQYVTRRDLAKFLTLGSALLVGANGALTLARRARAARAYPAKRIASAASLAAGDSVLFRYPTEDDPCILVRTRLGALVAFSQVCTHLSCAVVYRRSDDRLFCPCHNGLFDCREGENGAQPLEGPPERPLPRILIEVHGDDVFATGVTT
jgi:arsenite oxidase small subunit